MRAAGYIRVSTSDQADSGLGLDAQRAKVDAQAVIKDYEMVGVFEDAGESAKSTNRPALQTLLELVRQGQVDAVIVAKLDRLTRNIRDLYDMVEEFNKAKVALISASESIDTKSAMGEFMLTILGAVAQWERRAIGERTSEALQALKAQGKRTGTVPYGMTADADGNLVVNPEEQAVIERMVELREDGLSYEAVAKALAADGIRTRRGSNYSRSGIQKLLKSIGYGQVQHA